MKISAKLILFLFALFCFSNSLLADKFRFNNYKLVRITPLTVIHLDKIVAWEDNSDFDLWSRIKGVDESVTVLLSPEAFSKYKIYFSLLGMPFELLSDNMEMLFQEQEISMVRNGNDRSIVGKFARYNEIQNFIDDVVANNPSLASSYVAGKTYENRNLKVIILKSASSKRKVWIDCGIHAREWITPATCVWIINKLVTDHKSNSAQSLLNYFEFHILPLQNPDGYEYTFDTYRMWRKNRSKRNGVTCVGVDLNRNYGYQWLTGGSSTDPCSDTYAGPKQDSELETQAVQNAILKYKGQWDSFLTIHSFGLWWFTTWGYSRALPPNYSEVYDKAKIGVEAIKSVYGTSYTFGSSANILYVASGGSEDWSYGAAGVQYSYCLEVRPGQTGTDSFYGFSLPEDRAPKVGEETYQGIKAFLNSIKK